MRFDFSSKPVIVTDMNRPFVRAARPTHAPHSSWETVSDWYASYLSQPGNIQSTVIFPGAMRMLEPRANGSYFDLACGEGSFAKLLTKTTHCQVTGLDASASLIAKAKQSAPPTCKFVTGDATDFAKQFPTTKFDGMTCILAIQNISDLEPVFQDASKILRPGAPFVIVMNHPAFRQPRQSGWGFDEARKLQYRRIDRYLSPYEMPIIAHPGSNPSVKTYSYHRPLSTYVQTLSASNFMIDGCEEWISEKKSTSGPRAKTENVSRAEIPLFLALRARLIVKP